MNPDHELTFIADLAEMLKKTKELGEKQEILLSTPHVYNELRTGYLDPFLHYASTLSSKIALFSTVAINQHKTVFAGFQNQVSKKAICSLLNLLVSVDRFYESMGGIVGYQAQALTLLKKNREENLSSRAIFSQATKVDEEGMDKILDGIRAIAEMGEIYPIGGLGSRLNLMTKSAEPLPAACLLFCGRTLLEGLVRDVQAREFLYYRLFQKQVTIPIALMTSLEKKNDRRIRSICARKTWFKRPEESFFLFSQISVPVITEEGKWSMKSPTELNVQPGGHGALWKAAEEKGVFYWFECQEKNHLLIRQINNPISGVDSGLLSLMGHGKKEEKTFGFLSCQRIAQAAEGVLVLVEEGGSRRLSNIEYTDIKRYGITDISDDHPANTNILYVNLERILPVIKKNPLPGLILNMKNKEWGRLESMMQNISDALTTPADQPLSTFLIFGPRKKTISATKRSFEKGSSLLETPEGAFYDVLHNGHELLKTCGVTLAPFSTPEEYIDRGPSHIFLYHPALGPLYCLIKQKINKGLFANGSELQLEIADFYEENLNLDGSLLISAQNILGHDSQGIIRYSQLTGKCYLKNVTVKNRGINRNATPCYWQNKIKRDETMKIVLLGHSEFYAENITFQGGQNIVVPDGERWVAQQNSEGEVTFRIEKPTWKWLYQERHLHLALIQEQSSDLDSSGFTGQHLSNRSLIKNIMPTQIATTTADMTITATR